MQMAQNKELKNVLQGHMEAIEQQIQNLEQVFSQMGQEPGRLINQGAQGIVADGQQIVQETEEGPLCNCAIVAGQLIIEHVEIYVAPSTETAICAQKQKMTESYGQTLNPLCEFRPHILRYHDRAAPPLVQRGRPSPLPSRVLAEESNHLLGGVRPLGIGEGPFGVAARPGVIQVFDDPFLHERVAPRTLVDVSDVIVSPRHPPRHSVVRLVGDAVIVHAVVRIVVGLCPLRERLMGVHDVDH